MEESLKFNSQVCTTKEQSQRLLDLGLKPETADMSHQYLEAEWDWFIFPCDWNHFTMSKDLIPAWSLHRLIEMFHENILITKSNYIVVDNIFDFDASGNLYDNLISAFQHFFPEQYLNE